MFKSASNNSGKENFFSLVSKMSASDIKVMEGKASLNSGYTSDQLFAGTSVYVKSGVYSRKQEQNRTIEGKILQDTNGDISPAKVKDFMKKNPDKVLTISKTCSVIIANFGGKNADRIIVTDSLLNNKAEA